jgi:hypothetical protein
LLFCLKAGAYLPGDQASAERPEEHQGDSDQLRRKAGQHQDEYHPEHPQPHDHRAREKHFAVHGVFLCGRESRAVCETRAHLSLIFSPATLPLPGRSKKRTGFRRLEWPQTAVRIGGYKSLKK